MARRSSGVSAVARAVRVFDAFAIDRPFLTLTEIASRVGMPLSTTHRVTSELVELGLLERLPDKTYRVGNRLWELGTRTPGALGLREVALPALHWLQSEIRQHAQLVVRSDLDALVIDRLSARDAVVNASVIGGRTPLELTSSGIVLLAAEPAHIADAVLARGLRTGASGALVDARDFHTAIAIAARQGYWIAEGYVHDDATGIAAPIRGAQNVVVGAIGVVVPTHGGAHGKFAHMVLAAAERASLALQRSYLPAGHPDAGAGGPLRSLVNSSRDSMRYLEEIRREETARRGIGPEAE